MYGFSQVRLFQFHTKSLKSILRVLHLTFDETSKPSPLEFNIMSC
jgi:hypothetical protein